MFLRFFLTCALHFWICAKADFDVVLEDVDCTEINEEYVKTCDFELNYDSTYGSSLDSYLEIIKRLPDDTRIVADMFTVRMGEYNVDVGLHLDSNFCESARGQNTIGIPILRAVNMDGDSCPPEPGVYQREGYVIDNTDGLPSSFPSGHYLINMTFLIGDTTLMHFDAYIRVY